MDDLTVLGHWTAAMLRSSTPLLLVTLGEALTQQVGIHKFGCGGSDAWRRLHGLRRGFRQSG